MENAQATNGWYYERGGTQAGPVSLDVLAQMAANGEVNGNTLVWCAGMADWKPLSSQLAVPAGSASSSSSRRCDECGQMFPSSDILDLRGHSVCADCKPVVLQKMAEGVAPTGGGDGVWRHGKKLVFRNGSTLPQVCVKCGEPATTKMPRTLYWHKPWVYILILVSVLVYIIVAMVTRKMSKVEVPLCAYHRSRRTKGILSVWLLLLVFLGGFITAGSMDNPWFMLISLGSFIAMLVIGIRSRLLVPTMIDERVTHAKGCCDSFLAKLPEYRD
jgi:hypothetical protein